MILCFILGKDRDSGGLIHTRFLILLENLLKSIMPVMQVAISWFCSILVLFNFRILDIFIIFRFLAKAEILVP